jgi:S-adenosylmethionine synthetase
MSKHPDTVSQFVKGFHISDSFLKEDRLAVNPIEIVTSTGLTKITGRETLTLIDTKSKEITIR